MKHKHLKSIAILIIALGLAGCKHYPSAPAGGDIPAGYDAFKTDETRTAVRFEDEFAIPAGFFDTDSAKYSGTVALGGSPTGSFRGQTTGADTIVHRKGAATFYKETATVAIEVAVLSLKSVQPIRVSAGGGVQMWDLTVDLSPSRSSEGSMTLNRRDAKEGTYNAVLTVYPRCTFTRQSDGAQRKLDVGAMNLPQSSIEKITLRTEGAPWSMVNGGFSAGATSTLQRPTIGHNGRIWGHGIIGLPERLVFESVAGK